MFNKNLTFLNNEELKERLKRFSLDDTRKNMSYCMTPSNDYLLMKDEIPLDDINNPREAVKQMLKSTIKGEMGKNDIIIMFGIGLGYLLDEAFNTYESKIYLYEPDTKLLHFVLNNVDISEHLASGRVYITDNLKDLLNKLSATYINKDKVEVVYLKNYALVKSKELLELTQKVYETCKTKMVDVNTIARFSKKWLLNTLRNISTVNNTAVSMLSDLENKFIGQTALIIAAGPSLSENIEKIKANRDKFIIFAVNKVLRILEANGITPDFAVCMDASAISATYNGLEDYCAKINCISDLKSDAAILTSPFKKHFLTFSDSDFVAKKLINFNKSLKAYEFGGSATTMALVVAYKLGFSKIICTGLDLAFKNDIMYSTGETINKAPNGQIITGNSTKNIVKVKSVTGETVNTRDDYAAFINHFETLIKDLGIKEVYNTTSFGAAIEGMKNVAFDNIPLFLSTTGLNLILAEPKPFKIETKDWTQEELFLINNIISLLSKGVFSPALISAIVKSSLVYEYMQADIIQVMQSKFDPNLAEEFIEKAKAAIKAVVEYLQKYRLI